MTFFFSNFLFVCFTSRLISRGNCVISGIPVSSSLSEYCRCSKLSEILSRPLLQSDCSQELIPDCFYFEGSVLRERKSRDNDAGCEAGVSKSDPCPLYVFCEVRPRCLHEHHYSVQARDYFQYTVPLTEQTRVF